MVRIPKSTTKDVFDRGTSPVAVPLPQVQRRKGAGTTRTWLIISDSGKSHVEELGKHPIMRRTGLPGRDLRILDPVLLYPSTILGRERAIVVNLEHIKAIITATEALVLNSKDPSVAPFVHEFEIRVSNFNWARPLATEGSDTDMEATGKATGGFPPLAASHEASQQLHNLSKNSDVMGEANDNSPRDTMDVPKPDGPKVLPFEFKALEVCLETTCRCLETETCTLEQEAYPALDALTSKISTLNLQRVRQIKSRLVALFGRVQKVRDELENLLDDDMDMAEMYLTDKLVHQQSEEVTSKDEINKEAFELDDDSDDDWKSSKSNSRNIDFKPNVEELEMLLEAYFAQIEGTLNKLSTMREYVDDTEDYINIMLDEKQNQLLQMGVLLSTATLLINAGIVVVGLFGMNIHIDLFDSSPTKFWETTLGAIGGCLILYIIAIYCGKKRGLLE